MRFILLALLVLTTGCTLILEDKVSGFSVDPRPDMRVNLIAFEAHEFQRTEILLINDTGFVQGHVVLDPLPAPDFTAVLVNAVEPDIRRIDFWSDLDENGVRTTPTPDPAIAGRLIFHDHMWRSELSESGTLDFTHNTNFANIAEVDPAQLVAGPLMLTLSGGDEFNGQEAEVSVWLPEQDRQVGYYLVSTIEAGVIDASLSGIIDDGTTYRIEVSIGGGPLSCISVVGTPTGAQISTPVSDLGPCE